MTTVAVWQPRDMDNSARGSEIAAVQLPIFESEPEPEYVPKRKPYAPRRRRAS